MRHCYSTHFTDEQTKAGREAGTLLLSTWEMEEFKTLSDPPATVHICISVALPQALEMGKTEEILLI